MKHLHVVLLPGLFLAIGCSQSPRLIPEQRAAGLSASGAAAFAAGHHHTAAARYSAATDASLTIDDRAAASRDLHNRGIALLACGAAEASVQDFRESIRLAELSASPPNERAATRIALATAHVELGHLEEALASCRTAVDETASGGDAGLYARALASRAAVQLRRGDRAAAVVDLDAAIAQAAGNDGASGTVAVVRGHVLVASGDAPGADTSYARAVGFFRAAGDTLGLAAALDGAAHVAETTAHNDPTRLREAAHRWRRAAAVPAGGPVGAAKRLRAAARCLR
ncbi:MAG: hypothetical protein AAB263_18505, partial [Planctomycetota bacterium]